MQVLCVKGGVALLGQAEVDLCYYQADVDDYIPVKCSLHPDAITGNLLIFVVSCSACMHACMTGNMCHFPALMRESSCYIRIPSNSVDTFNYKLCCPKCLSPPHGSYWQAAALIGSASVSASNAEL